MLETPVYPPILVVISDSDKSRGADNQQERPVARLESSETIRRAAMVICG